MSPPKSKVWAVFAKTTNALEKQCKLCLRNIKFSGNTTNMLKHIKLHHREQYKTMAQNGPSRAATSSTRPRPPSPSSSTQGSCTSTTSLTNINELSQSQSTSASPTQESQDTIPSTLTQSSQSSESSRSFSSSYGIRECFQNVTSIKEGGTKHAAITNSILYFICKDNRPFHVVSGEGFIRMMKEVAPGYKIPSEKTFKNILDQRFDTLQLLFRQKFETVKFFSLTCDIWSETMSMRSFLGVTVHYFEGTTFQATFLATKELEERHTGINIARNLVDIVKEWNIPFQKIVAVVTDNGANMVSAVNLIEELGKSKHIPCFAHTLNLVAEAVVSNDSVAPIISKVREIVKWVKASVVISDQLRTKQRDLGVEEGNIKKLILDVKTRWNSVFYMLERYQELHELITPILLKTPNSPNVLTASDIELLKNLIALFQPLEFMTKECSGEQYITISKIIPLLYCCAQQLNQISAEDPIIKSCKTVLINEMTKRFSNIELCTPVALATLLDPRFKNLNFQNASACGTIIQKLKKLIDTECSSSSDNEEMVPEPEQVRDAEYSSQFWSHHINVAYGKEKFKKQTSRLAYDPSAKAEHELSLYLKNSVSPLKSNPLEVWEGMKSIFPNLYKIAQKYLVIVATSVPSERLFSRAGATVYRDRNRLLGKRLSKLLFLGSCTRKEWNM